MFNKKFSQNDALTVVVNQALYFVLFDNQRNGHIAHKIDLDQNGEVPPETRVLPEQVKNRKNRMLILPDYWMGIKTYPFQSGKRSLASAFIARKLQSENPSLSEVGHFFDFAFFDAGLEKRQLVVAYLQDPRAFALYNALSNLNFQPARITAPALIWEQKLLKTIPDFDISGTCFIHLLATECFLYFFFQGRFLFSRSITIPEFQEEPENTPGALSMALPQRFSVLTFEINQSLYLFVQKTKTELDSFYLHASDPDSTRLLSKELGREITAFLPGEAVSPGLQKDAGALENLGPVGAFTARDLFPAGVQMNLTHYAFKQVLEWKPVQMVAISLGILLLLLLSVEAVFLKPQTGGTWNQVVQSRNMRADGQKRTIRQYSQAIDLLLQEVARPSPRKVFVDVGRSLPKNAWVTGLDIEAEPNPGVVLQGRVTVSDVNELQETFSALLKNLNLYFSGSRSLSIQDIDFAVDRQVVNQGESHYLFTLKFDLP
jgi:hypothetical protein